MSNPVISENLQAWLDADAKYYGAPPICRNITTLDEKLTWDAYITSGMHSLVEKQTKQLGERLLKERLPNWLPHNFYVEVRTCRGNPPGPDHNIVVTSAYVVKLEKEDNCE